MKAHRPWLLALVFGVACSGGKGPGALPASAKPGPGAPPEIDRLTPLPSPLPDIVARVDGQPIYLRQIVGLAREGLDNSKDREKDKPGALRQAMHQFMVRELLFQEALARNLSADPNRLEQIYDDFRLKYRDEKAWTDYLATTGQTPQSFKEELRVQQTVQALVTEESAKVDVSEEEAKAYLAAHPNAFGLGDRASVARILARIPPGASLPRRAQSKVKADQALARIRKGEDFAKMAKEVSEDEATKSQGGRLPEFARGDMDPAFEGAVFGLQPGEVSEVVETASGFEIVKLLARRTERVSFDQARARLEPQLLRQMRQETLQGLVNRLRAKARIETFL